MTEANIKPFLKWIGGKRQLLGRITPMLPEIDVYHEPFLGGGALFFHLKREEMIRKSAYLSDLNGELITAYKVVQSQPQELMQLLESPMFVNSKSQFLKIRALNPTGLAPLMVAARMIFLNKTCYNGLYRVNKKGQFNAAWDKSSVKRRTHDPDAMLATAKSLQGVQFGVGDFEDTISRNIGNHSGEEFVFLDPPYLGRYAAYTGSRFEWEEHKRLFDLTGYLDDHGVKWMLCNSDHEDILTLYGEYNIKTVNVKYVVNTDGNGRSGHSDVIITNYGGT